MKISYLHGVCVRNDAISQSIRDEVTWLMGNRDNDVRLYAYACDYDSLPFTRVNEIWDVAFDTHFQNSDLVVFHFGVVYPLFDLIAATPKSAARLVVFHNITPRELVSAEARPTIDKSFAQMANMMFADLAICVSQTNVDALRTHGVTTPSSVLSIAVHGLSKAPDSKPSGTDGIVRITFIGRFVKSKGAIDLLHSIDEVLNRRLDLSLRVDLVGNTSFSDPNVLSDVRIRATHLQAKYRERVRIRISGDVSESEKNLILSEADLFVLPTYHEGFCVPIAEALSSACKVIAYDNSNISAISGGFASLIATGDLVALSSTIEGAVDVVLSSQWHSNAAGGYNAYAASAWQYAQQFSSSATRTRFLNFIDNFMRDRRRN
jgi:glycosyltransferase involved in cell wall biosynthesis